MDSLEMVLATRNRGKLREIQAILAPLGLKFLSLEDFPLLPEIPENGTTFVENAVLKAAAAARLTGKPALADDSGLAVDALQGRPGVYSARYGGEGLTDAQRTRRLLQEMAGIPQGQREAAFICALAAASPGGRVEVAEGQCRGEIALAPRGSHGFGYDPVFYLPDLGRTLAEVEPEVKNFISHRARALEKMKSILPNFLHR